MTKKILFIGLGHMGTPIALRLTKAGFNVEGFDVAEEARRSFEKLGGISLGSISEISDFDYVILMLPNSRIVSQVVNEYRLEDKVSAGSCVIDMGSSDPFESVKLAARFARRNIQFIDAPVSGGVARAQRGNLAIMVGGEEQSVSSAATIFETLGHAEHLGAVGAGHATKALNNLMSASHLLVSIEAMNTAKQFGIDPNKFLETVNRSSGRSGSTDNKLPNFILPKSYDSGFSLNLMVKDMNTAVTLATNLGQEIPYGKCALDFWQQAEEALPVGSDHTKIAQWIDERDL